MLTVFAAVALPAQSFAVEIDGKLGYKKGLYYESEDGRFKIKQNFRIQFRMDVADTNETGKKTETDFMIRRLKLKYGGHAYEKWLKWGFQLVANAGRKGKNDDVKVDDAFLVFAKSRQADLKAGRYKIPYEREVLNSSSSLQFVDRSFVKEFVIGEGRADGISTGGILGNIVAYRAGVFQKDSEEFKGSGNMLFAGRIQFNLCCGELKYSSGSFTSGGDYKITPNFAKVPTFSLGVGGFYYNAEKTDATYKTLPDSGSTLVDSTAKLDLNSNSGVTVDFAAKIPRANFETAFYYGSAKNDNSVNASLGGDGALGGSDANADTQGSAGTQSLGNYAYRVQGGFMMTPQFEIATRWSYADYDKKSSENDEWQWTTGLNYYIAAKHRAKIQVDYTYGSEKNGIQMGKDKKENIFRAQVQLYL